MHSCNNKLPDNQCMNTNEKYNMKTLTNKQRKHDNTIIWVLSIIAVIALVITIARE